MCHKEITQWQFALQMPLRSINNINIRNIFVFTSLQNNEPKMTLKKINEVNDKPCNKYIRNTIYDLHIQGPNNSSNY